MWLAVLLVVVLQMRKPLACAQESVLEGMVEEVAKEEARHLVVGCSLPNCVVGLVVVSEWKCQIVMEVHCANRCEEMVVELLGMTGLVMAGLAMTVVKLAVQLVVHHLLVVVNSLDVLAREWNGDEEKKKEEEGGGGWRGCESDPRP